MPSLLDTRFRAATTSDAQAIADVYLAARKRFLPFAPLAHSDDDVRHWIRTILVPAGGVTVAEAGSRIVGMMATSCAESVNWLDHLYLAPDAVGRGIGSRMLERAKGELSTPIRLYTFQANTAACRFYERHGFHPIAYSDGDSNEEKCPDVLYEWRGGA
ncbi:MAG TPA: GNAT family N-acetyltransferase [Paucimonas sp.]|nr:GNAT family N-acetyltransferase [Paucimonas sp.]